jgi:hypothetical protein
MTDDPGPAGTGWHAPAAAAPPTSAVAGSIVGTVRGFHVRAEPGEQAYSVWSFNLERFDELGNSLQPVPVEMRGLRFVGAIRNGEQVEAPGPWRPGETLHTTRVQNLTTGATVTAFGRPPWLIGLVAAAVLVVAAIAVVALLIFLQWPA